MSLTNTLDLPVTAGRLSQARSEPELVALLDALPRDERARLQVVGTLSNTVAGPHVEGHVVRYADGTDVRIDRHPEGGWEVTVDGAVSLDDVALATVEAGIGGMELLSGIPGTVGAGVVQNAGAYGQAISDHLRSVTAVRLHDGERLELGHDELGLGYRHSRWKWTEEFTPPVIVTSATFRLDGEPGELRYADLVRHRDDHGWADTDLHARRTAVRTIRDTKGMVVEGSNWVPSAGSFFVSPEVPEERAHELVTQIRGEDFAAKMASWYRPDGDTIRVPAAIVLRAAGFTNGDRWGEAVGLSPHHILAVHNAGEATGDDLHLAAAVIQRQVRDRLGITLEREVKSLTSSLPATGDAELDAWLEANPYRTGGDEPEWAKGLSA